MKSWLTMAFAIVTLAGAVHGQITINQSDYPQTPGTIYRSSLMSQTDGAAWTIANAGSGGGNTWDFSTIGFSFGFYPSTVVNAATTPGHEYFPDATRAWDTYGLTSWSFFSTPPNEFISYGSFTTYGVKPDTIKIIYDTPSLQTKFPITGNSTWITKFSYTNPYYDLDGNLLYTQTVKDSIKWECDAWGTVKFGSKEASAIRCRGTWYITTTTIYESLPPVEFSSSNEVCQFFTKDYGVAISLSRTVSMGSEYFSGSGQYPFVATATPVYEVDTEALPTELSVSQNSPNPFNPETTIRYSIGKASAVRFEIFNLLGQEVWHEDFGVQAPGTYELHWSSENSQAGQLPSGVYLYRVTAGDKSVSRKMILLK